MNSFRFADGRRLAWREAGTGPPLLLLHGWCFSSQVFAEALAAFSADYRVLAPDLPGHGAADPATDYGFAALAAELREWLAALSLDRIRLLGWSLGGQVALELAAALPPEQVGGCCWSPSRRVSAPPPTGRMGCPRGRCGRWNASCIAITRLL